MAEIINAVLSDEQANSYCTLDYANTYFANHYSQAKNTTWSALADAQKTQLLIQACFTIEQIKFTEFAEYNGARFGNLGWNNLTNRFGYFNNSATSSKYLFYQALQFPRNKDVYSTGDTYIPDRVMIAQCEQAIYLIGFDDSAIANAMQGISLDSIQVDKIKLTQEYTAGSRGTTLAPLALDYLKPYMLFSVRTQRS